jgi:hypothetical protein
MRRRSSSREIKGSLLARVDCFYSVVNAVADVDVQVDASPSPLFSSSGFDFLFSLSIHSTYCFLHLLYHSLTGQ